MPRPCGPPRRVGTTWRMVTLTERHRWRAKRRGSNLRAREAGMTASAPRWISESDVVQLIDLGDAIEALTRGLLEEAAGSARNMDKTAAHWAPAATCIAIGAVFEGADVFGTKTWGNTPAGSTLASHPMECDHAPSFRRSSRRARSDRCALPRCRQSRPDG